MQRTSHYGYPYPGAGAGTQDDHRHESIHVLRCATTGLCSVCRRLFPPQWPESCLWVVFAGHFEDDGRVEYLEEIVKNGFKLKLFGPGKYWDPVLQESELLRHLVPLQQVWGNDYNKALCGAKVALCFMSKLNKDTYTRRCFEIPATKTVLVSEHSDELATLYNSGVEADFFKSKQELIQILHRYVNNEAYRKSVAEAGYARVVADGHDVISRMKKGLKWLEEIKIKNLKVDY